MFESLLMLFKYLKLVRIEAELICLEVPGAFVPPTVKCLMF